MILDYHKLSVALKTALAFPILASASRSVLPGILTPRFELSTLDYFVVVTCANACVVCRQRTTANHIGYKPTTTTTAVPAGTTSTSGSGEVGVRGGLIQCNSSGAPYDVVQIEQLADTASLTVAGGGGVFDTPRTRSRVAGGILRHKETNF